MIAVIKAWLAPYTLYLKIAVIILLIYSGWYGRGVYERAQKVEQLNTAISDHLAGESNSFGIGLNLETGLNDYKFKSLELDRKVQDASSHDTGNRFDAAGVQRTSDRIATGVAARKRSNQVQ